MSATVVSNNPGELYARHRSTGRTHVEAVRLVAHAYGRRPKEMSERLDRARRNFEASRAPEPEPELTVEPEHEQDVFQVRLADLAAQVATLDGERAALALGSLTDAKAKTRLAKVEVALTSARAEIEHVELARAESVRREREQRQQSAQQAVEDAMRRAAELGADRLTAAAAVDDAGRRYAEALAAHQRVASLQLAALTDANPATTWKQVMPDDDTLASSFAFALQQGGAPAGWVELDLYSVRHAAPLTDLDRRPIEAASPDPSN